MDTVDERVREEEVAFEENGDECAICLQSNFPPENPLRELPCGHGYHLKCLRTLNNTSEELRCPMCRDKFSEEDYEPNNNGSLLYNSQNFGHMNLQDIIDATSNFSEKNILTPDLSIRRLISLFMSTEMVMHVDVNTLENAAIRTQNFSFNIIKSPHRNSRGYMIGSMSVKEQLDSEIKRRLHICNYGLVKTVRILNNREFLKCDFGVSSGFPLTDSNGKDLTPAELFAGSPDSIAKFARKYRVDDHNKCLMKNLLMYIETPARQNPQFKRCTINFFTSVVVIPPGFEDLFEADSYQQNNNPFFDTLSEFPQDWIFPFKSSVFSSCPVSGGNKRKTNKRKRQTNKRKSNKKRQTNKRKNK